MNRLFKYLFLLLYFSFYVNVEGRDYVLKQAINDSSAVSDSLLFFQLTERYNYHLGIRSDSVSWYTDELIKLAERNDKHLEVIRLYSNKATELMNSGNYSAALEYFTRAFEMEENPEIENNYWTLGIDPTPEKRRQKILSFLHFNYGHLMDVTENNEERLRQYRIANQIAVDNNDLIIQSYTSSALAIAFLEKNEIDSAQTYNSRSIELYEQLPSRFYYSFAMWTQGNIHMELQEYSDAYRFYLAGKKSAQEENNYQGLLINYLGLSQYFYQVNEPDSSLYYAYRTTGNGSIPDFQALKFDIGVAYENLHRVYKLRGDVDNALKYLELAKSTRDSLNNLRIENLALFQQNLLNQQLEQKERERQFESAQARNRIIAILILLFVVIIVAVVLYRNYKIKKTANQRLDEANSLLSESLDKLVAAQDQLVQQEKLASLGQLTAGIAHEIKNPLNFVNNFSDVSLELVEEVRSEIRDLRRETNGETESPLSRGEGFAKGNGRGVLGESENRELNSEIVLEILDDIEANLRTIHKHGSRADGIVKSMLQHSRGGNGKMEQTSLNPMINEYVNLAYHGMLAGDDPINVDIDLELDDSVGSVPLIAEDFSRVIINLVNNAFDAMREKAKSKSEKSSKDLTGFDNYQPRLIIRTFQKENTVTIEIEDNGHGIPDEIKDKILQPFFTTKKGTAGTGLGLSITNDIIKAHGGQLHVQTLPERGTVFSVELPAY